MNNNLPLEYITSKFIQYVGFPKYKKYTKLYEGSCPICHEGKSWGKKKRCYFIPRKELITCQNCQRSWSPLNWIIQVSGSSYKEVMEEAKEYNHDYTSFNLNTKKPDIKSDAPKTSTLPKDSINLFDPQQLNYYKSNIVIQDALKFIQKRRLNTLYNKPKALYISLKDYIHKNRICIPFYDIKGNIIFYQTRAIYKEDQIDRPKYLSKVGADKSIYGLDKVNPECDYLFIFEGPIDSMCVESGIAMGGITLSDNQEEELKTYHLYKRIWILDNQTDNENVMKKMKRLLEDGERVFIWPDKFKEYKDMNEICVKFKLDQVSESFFVKNSMQGLQGLIKLGDNK